MDFRARGGECGGQAFADFGVGVEEEESVALGAARADGGELAQRFDEFSEGRGKFGHGRRAAGMRLIGLMDRGDGGRSDFQQLSFLLCQALFNLGDILIR